MPSESATSEDAVAYEKLTDGPVSAPATEVLAELVEPIRENGSGDGRGTDGRFLPGNQVARQTGIYAQKPPPDVQAYVERFTAGIVADPGGEHELSTLERGRICRLAGVEGTLLLLEVDIARRGLLTPAGGVRRIYDDYLDGVRTGTV